MKEDFDIKKDYDKLKKKYNLPDFEELNKEFELELIEKKEFLLKTIRRRVNDKAIFFCKILESVLYNNGQNQIGLYESGFFDDIKKAEMSNIHKKLMVYERQSLLLDIEGSEIMDVEYINEVYGEWKEIRGEMKKVVLVMESAWKKETLEEEEKYFG